MVLAGGRSAILAVPDYRDQEQLVAALLAVLPAERIVRLDARQSNPDRYRAFLRCLGDDALVIVGNRSVVYAPARNLGLIAVWDDGDPLHAEPLAPYVHTRDAALLRQELQGCALVFLGHSRSTEVERLVELGWLASVSPSPSVHPRVIPTLQQESGDRLAAQARIPSTAWRAAQAALADGPVLVQVARPGYAPRLACADCGQSARCRRCEGPLAQRTARSVPACSWCGALAVDWRCENCGGTRLRLVGAGGATRTAEDLGRAFPGVRVIIADGERPILSVGPEPALVIATRARSPSPRGDIAPCCCSTATACWRARACGWGRTACAGGRTRSPSPRGCADLSRRRRRRACGGAVDLAAGRLRPFRARRPTAAALPARGAARHDHGTATAVAGAVDVVTVELSLPRDDVLGPVETGSGSVRTIVRFDYGAGAEVAAALRAEVIRSATNRRRSLAASGVPTPALRVRFDDTEPF